MDGNQLFEACVAHDISERVDLRVVVLGRPLLLNAVGE